MQAFPRPKGKPHDSIIFDIGGVKPFGEVMYAAANQPGLRGVVKELTSGKRVEDADTDSCRRKIGVGLAGCLIVLVISVCLALVLVHHAAPEVLAQYRSQVLQKVDIEDTQVDGEGVFLLDLEEEEDEARDAMLDQVEPDAPPPIEDQAGVTFEPDPPKPEHERKYTHSTLDVPSSCREGEQKTEIADLMQTSLEHHIYQVMFKVRGTLSDAMCQFTSWECTIAAKKEFAFDTFQSIAALANDTSYTMDHRSILLADVMKHYHDFESLMEEEKTVRSEWNNREMQNTTTLLTDEIVNRYKPAVTATPEATPGAYGLYVAEQQMLDDDRKSQMAHRMVKLARDIGKDDILTEFERYLPNLIHSLRASQAHLKKIKLGTQQLHPHHMPRPHKYAEDEDPMLAQTEKDDLEKKALERVKEHAHTQTLPPTTRSHFYPGSLGKCVYLPFLQSAADIDYLSKSANSQSHDTAIVCHHSRTPACKFIKLGPSGTLSSNSSPSGHFTGIQSVWERTLMMDLTAWASASDDITEIHQLLGQDGFLYMLTNNAARIEGSSVSEKDIWGFTPSGASRVPSGGVEESFIPLLGLMRSSWCNTLDVVGQPGELRHRAHPLPLMRHKGKKRGRKLLSKHRARGGAPRPQPVESVAQLSQEMYMLKIAQHAESVCLVSTKQDDA